MAFLIVGVLLLLLRFADVAPVSGWDWWWFAVPFGLAVAWWTWADRSGLTQRRAMEKMEERKRQRRERDMKALGLDVRRERRIRVLREARPDPPTPPPPAEEPRRDPRL